MHQTLNPLSNSCCRSAQVTLALDGEGYCTLHVQSVCPAVAGPKPQSLTPKPCNVQVTLALGGEGYLNFMGNEFGHPEWIDFPRDDTYDPSTGEFVPGDPGCHPGTSPSSIRRAWVVTSFHTPWLDVAVHRSRHTLLYAVMCGGIWRGATCLIRRAA